MTDTTLDTKSTEHSYRQIFRSTLLIGASSLANVVFGIVRSKAMALLLGPAGVGLIGLYNALAELCQTAAGLGVQASGVRQIADAAGADNNDRINRTVATLRLLSLLLGIAGLALIATVSTPLAEFTFGEPGYAGGVALLGVAVALKIVSGGQLALLQGLRRIGDVARIGVISGFFSTAIAVPLVWLYGEDGIVPGIVGMAVVTLATSWWYARKTGIAFRLPSRAEWSAESAPLLRLGLAFMASGLLTAGAGYAVRLVVLENGGIDAAGLYQSAWVLGGIYASFILQAMGVDFYPRLTAVVGDRAECRQLVNEQARISMLLAAPGVLGSLTVAPFVMIVFYSAAFAPAADLLRWICLGMMLRIVAWPMGYIVLAQGAQTVFFWTEVAATVVHVGLAAALVPVVGINGAGMAFFGLYVWHGLLIYAIVNRTAGFRWSGENLRLGAGLIALTAAVFAATQVLPTLEATAVGVVVTTGVGFWCLRQLLTILGPDHKLTRALVKIPFLQRP